ncbi:MAG TPA: NifB/NifX family molybdenum-iron cluster-binding protein [Syntrophales bacterium]|jgi:predicted Fe-Mo cluster-binding NifX family protein|nr:NifB/NifX family molybdenum-iron cluster-binding protein [Syntrophales bacterium]HOX93777.1 NifB/NifX family molybdenum-iron cluster-binding protein [Syntrophales bacterium]HPI57726.1 NifB/NifX family molybdenum-iron cluster-binding protein [Syntrophales bacterium]HPN23959.1 NifB/NifX family molybdenum-iron cluster-binding protein [Syntrophales bacterium]HQM28238.1 NifB/NifX family molybdenum-iron cluster-binding protein [Syntrophales bacterium]
MKIAICQFKGRISPRYNHSTEIVTVIIGNGQILERKVVALTVLEPPEFTEFLAGLGIEAVICGGVKEECRQMLKRKKIRLIDNVIGNVDAVLERFKTGELNPGDIVN